MTKVVPLGNTPKSWLLIIVTFWELSKIFGSSHVIVSGALGLTRNVGGLMQPSIVGGSLSLTILVKVFVN